MAELLLLLLLLLTGIFLEIITEQETIIKQQTKVILNINIEYKLYFRQILKNIFSMYFNQNIYTDQIIPRNSFHPELIVEEPSELHHVWSLKKIPL